MKRIILFFLLLFVFPVSCHAELRIHFIDVGQGDSILVQCDGCSLLIDAGPVEAGTSVNQYLHQTLGLSDVDYLVATHEHDDHIGGICNALSGLTVGKIYTSSSIPVSFWLNNLLPVLNQSGLEIAIPANQESFHVGDAVATFLVPVIKSENANDYSVVLRIDYGGNSALLTADIEGEAETGLLDQGFNVNADLLKIAHHGGDTSTCEAFLKAVNPQFAVISVGKGNKHGHPHAGPLRNLANRNVTVYRTDLFGTIIAVSDGNNWIFEVSKAR